MDKSARQAPGRCNRTPHYKYSPPPWGKTARCQIHGLLCHHTSLIQVLSVIEGISMRRKLQKSTIGVGYLGSRCWSCSMRVVTIGVLFSGQLGSTHWGAPFFGGYLFLCSEKIQKEPHPRFLGSNPDESFTHLTVSERGHRGLGHVASAAISSTGGFKGR